MKHKGTLLLLVYVLTSVYGATWIADEYNDLRAAFYGYFALPLAVLFFHSAFLSPQFWAKRQGPFRWAQLLLFICFLWGNILLVNGLTGNEDLVWSTVFKADNNDRTLNLAYQKGGFGLFYRARW